MTRLIDVDSLKREIKRNAMLAIVERAETVDAVKVVRCGECKYWWAEERQCVDEIGFARRWNADDYCSRGKRREE